MNSSTMCGTYRFCFTLSKVDRGDVYIKGNNIVSDGCMYLDPVDPINYSLNVRMGESTKT